MKNTSTLVLTHILWRGLYYFSVLLINISIAHFFAAEKSGQIFFIVNNLALILLIASISLESGCNYYVSSGIVKSSQISRFCLIWAVFASLLALAAWVFITYQFHPVYLSNNSFILASFLFILGVLLSTYFTALFNAKKQFGAPNKILFFINMVLIILLFTCRSIAVIKANFLQIYFAFYFLQGLIMMLIYFRMETSERVSVWPNNTVIKKILKYSFTALVANLIYFLVNRIDYWFVQHYCSPVDLGNYIQASKLAQMLLILPGIVGATLFSIFSSERNSTGVPELSIAIRVLLWLNVGLCFLITCFGWFIIPFFFGTSFGLMYYLFVLLIPGILCVTMNYPLASWFSSKKKISVNIRASLLAIIIICAGDIVSLPIFGVRAASVVSSIAFIGIYIYGVYTYRKENPVPWKDLLMFRRSDFFWLNKSLRTDVQESLPENIAI
jgi:O-antigen/teichoic acid export membrane protein